jgi:broad specificity phosphatase PhoE
MLRLVAFIPILLLASCKTTTYYIVRHAEKGATPTMTTDVPLSATGEERAIALQHKLENKNIRYIFSTNYQRTRATAEPLRKEENLIIQLYDSKDTLGSFINRLKRITNGNVLVVGHSNTVDDLVNTLTSKAYIPGDLQDSEYGDLFIVKKKGKNYSFRKDHFGNTNSTN